MAVAQSPVVEDGVGTTEMQRCWRRCGGEQAATPVAESLLCGGERQLQVGTWERLKSRSVLNEVTRS